MKFRYCFFIFIFLNAIFFNISANNPDTSKTDTSKTEIRDFSYSFFSNFKSNPALTGIQGGQTLSNEAGINNPLRAFGNFYHPQFYSFLFDAAFGKKRNFATGIFVNEAKGGAIENPSAGLAVSKTFNLSGSNSFYHKLIVGASIEYNIVHLSYDTLTFGDMINPLYGFIYYTQETKPSSLNRQFVNFSAGLWYHNPVFYLGLSARNLNQPNVSQFALSVIPMELYFSSGGKLKLSKQFSLHPSFNVTVIKGYKGKLNSYSPAVICSYRQKYNLGLSYMDLNKIGIHAGFVLVKHLTLLATCAFSTNADLYQFGTLSYLGGKMQYNFKN
ncbi:MAG: type IX secretion system membrane protein PorP/SprF [Bacteroidota bacterium]